MELRMGRRRHFLSGAETIPVQLTGDLKGGGREVAHQHAHRHPVILSPVIALIVGWHEKKKGGSDFSMSRIFPWFILWFLVASGAIVIPAATRAGARTRACQGT